jgi:hypothetical protein
MISKIEISKEISDIMADRNNLSNTENNRSKGLRVQYVFLYKLDVKARI